MTNFNGCPVVSPDRPGQKTWLESIQKLLFRLIELDQPEYNQDWSIVKHSNVLQRVVCIVQPEGSCEDAHEAVGALKR